MCIAVIYAIVKEFVRKLEIGKHRRKGVKTGDDIWSDSATVLDGTSRLGVESAAQRIGKMERLAVGTAMLEVAGLHTTSRRDVVL